jgi:hypothetical protein
MLRSETAERRAMQRESKERARRADLRDAFRAGWKARERGPVSVDEAMQLANEYAAHYTGGDEG